MSTLFPKTIAYKSVTGVFTNGVWVKTETDSTFEGSVQPMSGKEIESLNVGRSDLGKVKIYSSTPLKVSIVKATVSTTSGDVLIWMNKRWEIIAELVFQNDLIPHYKYIAEFREEV